MAKVGSKQCGSKLIAAILIGLFIVHHSVLVSAEPSLKHEAKTQDETHKVEPKTQTSGYRHVWPHMKFSWKIVVSTMLASFGAACGSIAGVGGGGIFVSMLTLIIGFDSKSATAISKCMITGTTGFTLLYNIRQRHPTLDLPLIDYDLALLFQPMLMLGISIGVVLNLMFAEWMITTLLMVLAIALSTRTFFKGVETWKKETIILKEAARHAQILNEETKEAKRTKVSITENIRWKELGVLVAVWVLILALQIAKNYTTTCSVMYWILNLLQIPAGGMVTAYEAVALYKGRRTITSKGDVVTKWKVYQLVLCCLLGVMAGIVGGLLGLGGGFIVSPLLLELGVPPQVSSATTTFAMFFSSTMTALEYYLLKRFPLPYAAYFFGAAMVGAFIGQTVMTRLIKLLGRASLIIFVLASTIFVSSTALGGVGLAKMIEGIRHGQYMGFYDLCSYKA